MILTASCHSAFVFLRSFYAWGWPARTKTCSNKHLLSCVDGVFDYLLDENYFDFIFTSEHRNYGGKDDFIKKFREITSEVFRIAQDLHAHGYLFDVFYFPILGYFKNVFWVSVFKKY